MAFEREVEIIQK